VQSTRYSYKLTNYSN